MKIIKKNRIRTKRVRNKLHLSATKTVNFSAVFVMPKNDFFYVTALFIRDQPVA